MRQGYLIADATKQRVSVGNVLVIGRTNDCGLVIEDNAASRRHMEIVNRGSAFIWKDLGSTNGTFVNGARMLGGELKDGDEIRIGETVFRFECSAAAAATAAPRPLRAKHHPGDDSTIFRETIIDSQGKTKRGPSPNKSTRLLEAVYAVTNAIATNFEPCGLIDQILQTTLKAINAQRGALFLSNGTLELLPCPLCGMVHTIDAGALSPLAPGAFEVSSTVTSRVLEAGESVLFQDTDAADELNAAQSIMALQLRSIICVPLRAKHRIIGILYIDSNTPGQSYSHDDMLLATAVGNSAGLALENAQMHLEILEKHRMDHEIATAWTIQQGFLVKEWPEDDPRFRVYGETRPAKTVGGDFYDFVHPDPHTIGILIGDVSGKGVPAALTMAQLLAEFRLQSRETPDPAEVLRRMNLALVERSQRGLFCTLLYFTLDLRNGALRCANAGHHAALRIGADAVTPFAPASGPPAGILPGAQWSAEAAELAPGETVLLYTDGIVEARRPPSLAETQESASPVEFDETGLLELLAQGPDLPPDVLIQSVNAAVAAFCAPDPPHDDCTMIAVRYHGPA